MCVRARQLLSARLELQQAGAQQPPCSPPGRRRSVASDFGTHNQTCEAGESHEGVWQVPSECRRPASSSRACRAPSRRPAGRAVMPARPAGSPALAAPPRSVAHDGPGPQRAFHDGSRLHVGAALWRRPWAGWAERLGAAACLPRAPPPRQRPSRAAPQLACSPWAAPRRALHPDLPTQVQGHAAGAGPGRV